MCVKGLYKICVIIGMTFAIFGCVSASSIGKAELLRSFSYNEYRYSDNIYYAKALAKEYIIYSDRASRSHDLIAILTIGSAATAAGGILYGAHMDVIKGAGLAAGSINASASYFKPRKTSIWLINAAEQLLCIANKGREVQHILKYDTEAAGILNEGILKVRLKLRKALIRDTPDYSDILKKLTEDKTKGAEFREEKNNNRFAIDGLREKIEACTLLPL